MTVNAAKEPFHRPARGWGRKLCCFWTLIRYFFWLLTWIKRVSRYWWYHDEKHIYSVGTHACSHTYIHTHTHTNTYTQTHQHTPTHTHTSWNSGQLLRGKVKKFCDPLIVSKKKSWSGSSFHRFVQLQTSFILRLPSERSYTLYTFGTAILPFKSLTVATYREIYHLHPSFLSASYDTLYLPHLTSSLSGAAPCTYPLTLHL